MVIKEIQILSEALWESVKTDLSFFSPIQSFVRKLADFNYVDFKKEDLTELIIYVNRIESFFKDYRPTGGDFYIPPQQTARNEETVRSILALVNDLSNMTEEQLATEIELFVPKSKKISSGHGYVFIGHGGSKVWARVQVFLKDELNLKTISYESESHTSESIISILNEFLEKASYAILILTAEDETIEGKVRARQNVIHEAGLFQGRLGFDKVIIIKQDKTEEFTNINGLQHISFTDDNVEQTFYELTRTLKKAGLII